MAKNKKRKKHRHPNQMGGYKKFYQDMLEAISVIGIHERSEKIANKYKRLMYDSRIRISNPIAANEYISSKELNTITQKIKQYYRQKTIKIHDKYVSIYQLMLQYCYFSVQSIYYEKELGGKEDPELKKLIHETEKLYDTFGSEFLLSSLKIAIQLSNPCDKYFGIKFRTSALGKANVGMELITEIVGVPSCKIIFKVSGEKRTAYRLGGPNGRTIIKWVTLDRGKIPNSCQKDGLLDVYMQSHAYRRLSQRLDLLNPNAINYLIWENTFVITSFVNYKDYHLLPVKLHNIKVGYLLAKVIDDKLLFRTFLFITHNCTPEGDKLKQISGLGKHDISYWKIDRLSTFVNLDAEKHKALISLFHEAGIEDFSQLRDKDFHVDSLQSVNLEGLMDYIKKGQQAEQVQEEAFAEFLAGDG